MPSTAALIALLVLATPGKLLPTLSKEPKLEGQPSDFQGAQVKVAGEAAGLIDLKAGFRKDTLYVFVAGKVAQPSPNDAVAVSLFFPAAGITARGARYLFGPQGRRDEPEGAPAWAQQLLKAAVKTEGGLFNLALAIPARALPRLPAKGALSLELCVELFVHDGDATELKRISTCSGGEMAGGPVRLPDGLLKTLKVSPPAEVEGLEPRPTGWVGYASLHYPTWAVGDAALTPASLVALVAGEEAVDPKSVALPLPESLTLEDHQLLFTVLTGKNPYTADGCHPENELRLALYAVKGSAAFRALEWPAATCSLGRAMSFELGPDGGLSVGYTNGSTAHFSWSGDHFERSELGQR